MPEATTCPRALVIEREMAHPLETVWRALTQRSLIAQWLMENDFEPVVGRKFKVRHAPMPNWSGVTECEVLTVEPPTRLVYSWHPFEGFETIVSWSLTPTKNGTLVHFEQSGFRPDQKANYRGARYGWMQFIGGLEHVVAGLD